MEGSLQHTFHERGECTGALRIAQETTQGYWGRRSSSLEWNNYWGGGWRDSREDGGTDATIPASIIPLSKRCSWIVGGSNASGMGLSLYGFFFLSSCGSCLNHQLWWWIFWVSKSENLCNQPGGDDDDLAVILLVMGYMHRFVTQWAGFWLTVLLQFCRWEISQHLSCNKLHKSLKCLLQVEKLMVLMTGWMLDWVFKNQETHHWHEFLSVFLVSEFVGFLLVADVYMSRWMSFFAGDLIFELV